MLSLPVLTPWHFPSLPIFVFHGQFSNIIPIHKACAGLKIRTAPPLIGIDPQFFFKYNSLLKMATCLPLIVKKRRNMMNQTIEMPRNVFYAPLVIMKNEGVPIRAIIDIGSADGTFALQCLKLFGRGITIFNIDAQQVYEPSLRKIREKVGGHYKICAVSAYNGQMRFSIGKSPYWAGPSPTGEYLECRTLDSLLEEFTIPEPYFIKMDIEGGEFSALQGAVNVLEKTAGMVLETDIYYGKTSPGNFLDIYSFLAARNFSLFDLTNFAYRQSDQALRQIYSTFLNKSHEFRDKQGFLGNKQQESNLTEAMHKRRQNLLGKNEDILSKL
jgi:FkbM family methyltransferase